MLSLSTHAVDIPVVTVATTHKIMKANLMILYLAKKTSDSHPSRG